MSIFGFSDDDPEEPEEPTSADGEPPDYEANPEDVEPWDPAIVSDPNSAQWECDAKWYYLVSAPIDGGDQTVIYNPDPKYMGDEWIVSDDAVECGPEVADDME